MDTYVLDIRDGRELCFSEAGDRNGSPVFMFHGTPSSRRRLLFPMAGDIATNAGVRLIVPDRPGYGHSTFQPGRRLTDWPSDVTAIADHLGIERFAAIGVSGGGPHALVCAAMLPDRVTRTGVVSGVGPLSTASDAEGIAAMNRLLLALARRSEKAAIPVTTLMVKIACRWPERAITSMMRQLPPSDVAVLERPEIRQSFVVDARHASATSARATAQDMALFTRPWGFELSQVAGPVDFWQGDADRTVPPAHARRQADQVKEATLHDVAGRGHFIVFDHLEEILRAVVG